jgi:hypothetical protein
MSQNGNGFMPVRADTFDEAVAVYLSTLSDETKGIIREALPSYRVDPAGTLIQEIREMFDWAAEGGRLEREIKSRFEIDFGFEWADVLWRPGLFEATMVYKEVRLALLGDDRQRE